MSTTTSPAADTDAGTFTDAALYAFLGRFRPWLHYVANRFAEGTDLQPEDLAQEGWIALWRAVRDYGKTDERYLHVTARNRMRLIAGGRPPLGSGARRGPRTEPTIVDSLDRAYDKAADGWMDDPLLVATAVDMLDGVEAAYHDGEIAQALAALPFGHRQYVVARFWLGMTDVEIAAMQERDKRDVGRTWKRTIRPKLAERLGHLAAA